MADDPDALDKSTEELVKQLKVLNRNLQRGQSWKLALRNGFIAAIGGAIGTTIILTVVVKFLKPYIQDLQTSLHSALGGSSKSR